MADSKFLQTGPIGRHVGATRLNVILGDLEQTTLARLKSKTIAFKQAGFQDRPQRRHVNPAHDSGIYMNNRLTDELLRVTPAFGHFVLVSGESRQHLICLCLRHLEVV